MSGTTKVSSPSSSVDEMKSTKDSDGDNGISIDKKQLLDDFMFAVPRGAGGWDVSEFLYQVRSPTYLKDKKKTPSLSPLFNCIGLQMMQMPPPPKISKNKKGKNEADTTSNSIHVALREWSALPRADLDNEYLIVNYIVPGSPGVQVVMYFRASEEALECLRLSADETKKLSGWQKLLHEFWKGEQSFCDSRFKLIPSMDKKAPWAVKMAVGEKPALVGKKLRQFYFRGRNYFEIDMDISSSSAASRILSLVRSLSTSLIVDVGLTIEGTSAEDLPERILCQCRLWGLDFNKAMPHPTELHRYQTY